MEPSSQQNPASCDLLLVNPVAGGGRAADVLPKLKEFARRRKWPVEICVTESPEHLAGAGREAAATGRQRIFVLGGDGTFQVLINAVQEFRGGPILGIIPAGGGNDLAASLGLPPDPLRAAGLLLQGEPCFLDAARVRTAEGNERLYTGGGGVGLDAESARYASGVYRNLRVRSRYLLSAIRGLAGFHAIYVRVHLEAIEPQTLEAKALLLGVLNTPSYGAGLRLAPHAQTDDGSLDLVLLEDLSLGEILALLPSLARCGELKTRRVRRFAVHRVRIETQKPCLFHGDGEILGTTPVEVSVVPRAVRVLRAMRSAAR